MLKKKSKIRALNIITVNLEPLGKGQCLDKIQWHLMIILFGHSFICFVCSYKGSAKLPE